MEDPEQLPREVAKKFLYDLAHFEKHLQELTKDWTHNKDVINQFCIDQLTKFVYNELNKIHLNAYLKGLKDAEKIMMQDHKKHDNDKNIDLDEHLN
jgi:hypothetical protein